MIESAKFRTWAHAQGLQIVEPVINAKGGGNLLPHNMGPAVARLAVGNPDHIVVLTDLEREPDVAAVRKRITSQHTSLIFVAVKALEAWFLADTEAMRQWLRAPTFHEPTPEATPGMPWDHLKTVAQQNQARGPGPSKVIFARNFCTRHGYQLANAANHGACPSARAFHDALIGLAAPNPVALVDGGRTVA